MQYVYAGNDGMINKEQHERDGMRILSFNMVHYHPYTSIILMKCFYFSDVCCVCQSMCCPITKWQL